MRKRKKIIGGEFRAAVFGVVVFGLFAIGVVVWAQTSDVTINAVVASDVTATIDSVKPQARIGTDQTNSDTTFYLTVRTSDDNDDSILFTQPTLVTTGVDGIYAPIINLIGISAGTYDIGLKGHQHLTRVLDDVTLVNGNNVLNFTKTDNSAGRGSVELLAGDVNGVGTTPATLGDDVVNAVDLSTLITVLDDDDPTGNTLRPNLNQDIVVNSVDISWMISNLDVEGDN